MAQSAPFLPATTSPENKRRLAVWLAAVAVMVIVMVIIGGATRLTESGLSITEWKVVTGTLPPLSEQAWQAEFEKYRQIPEYKLINKGMSLEEFKGIYWWEWVHRLWGRLIGLAFFIPMVTFFAQKRIGRDVLPVVLGLFVLGGLQGALGWYMVQSGLTERTDVSQYRLAAHLSLAFIVLGALCWMALRWAVPVAPTTCSPALRWSAIGFLGLIFMQIILGAFVAGLNAGMIYNTWPLMDGAFVPGNYLSLEIGWRNLFENMAAVQFNHRIAAYAVLAAAAALAVYALRLPRDSRLRTPLLLCFAAVVGQVLVGIWTLLAVVPISLGLLHQAGAMLVYVLAVYAVHLTHPMRT